MHAAQAMVQAINALPPRAAVPPPLPMGRFLQTPLSAGLTTILDLNTKEGRKYYEPATCSLYTTTEKFDMKHNSTIDSNCLLTYSTQG